MEFTKDMMFHIKYEQDKGVLMINKQERKNGFLGAIQRHKFVTCMCLIGVSLISVDVILINNFINILKQI